MPHVQRRVRLRSAQAISVDVQKNRPGVGRKQNREGSDADDVRVTIVGREVGAYNRFSEHVTAAQLLRVSEWTVEIGAADEGVHLEQRGDGSLMVELRGELRRGYWDEPAEVIQFKLQVEPQELRRGARELRAELEGWQALFE